MHEDMMVSPQSPGQNFLTERLPFLLPEAVAWVADMEHAGLRMGRPLAPWQTAEARDVGVCRPECVRICLVRTLPAPRNQELLAVAEMAGLAPGKAAGLTLGYSIYLQHVRAGQSRLLRHELRHVAQYESAGSNRAFLTDYLQQVARYGYRDAPLEIDARRYESPTPALTQKNEQPEP
jgi:hypothetical protein